MLLLMAWVLCSMQCHALSKPLSTGLVKRLPQLIDETPQYHHIIPHAVP